MTISNYSTTASNNTSINGINISEGMSPSDVNNSIRSQLADVRSGFNDKEWFLLGDGDQTTTFNRASASSVTVASNITSTYHVGRRVKIIGSATGTIFGKIATSSFSSPKECLHFWSRHPGPAFGSCCSLYRLPELWVVLLSAFVSL